MRPLAGMAMLLLLMACSPPGGQVSPKNGGDRTMNGGSPAEKAKVPPGAIPIGDEVYAVPIGRPDADGCQRYRLWSPTKVVVQAIHYRRADGRFTMRKDEAACMNRRK